MRQKGQFMSILSDYHVHTSHSGDSKTPMEEMILQGISKGLTTMCFTEHNDFDFPITDLDPEGKFECNADLYFKEFKEYQKKYADRIQLLFGIELGLQPSVMTRNKAYVEAHEFDFIIGSSHLCNGIDPSCPEFYMGRSEEEAYRKYFESVVENILSFSDFDVYGHLDYVVRYGPNADKEYSYVKRNYSGANKIGNIVVAYLKADNPGELYIYYSNAFAVYIMLIGFCFFMCMENMWRKVTRIFCYMLSGGITLAMGIYSSATVHTVFGVIMFICAIFAWRSLWKTKKYYEAK